MKKVVITLEATGQSTKSMLMTNLMVFQARSILVTAVYKMQMEVTMATMVHWYLVVLQVLHLVTGID